MKSETESERSRHVHDAYSRKRRQLARRGLLTWDDFSNNSNSRNNQSVIFDDEASYVPKEKLILLNAQKSNCMDFKLNCLPTNRDYAISLSPDICNTYTMKSSPSTIYFYIYKRFQKIFQRSTYTLNHLSLSFDSIQFNSHQSSSSLHNQFKTDESNNSEKFNLYMNDLVSLLRNLRNAVFLLQEYELELQKNNPSLSLSHTNINSIDEAAHNANTPVEQQIHQFNFAINVVTNLIAYGKRILRRIKRLKSNVVTII